MVFLQSVADTQENVNSLWLIIGAAMVLLMTPGLAFFYGGMVKSKSVISMMMMSFGAIALVSVLWVLYGYSMSFGLQGTDKAGNTVITDWIWKGWLLNPFANAGLLQFIGQDPHTGFMAGADASVSTLNSVGDTNSLAFVAFQALSPTVQSSARGWSSRASGPPWSTSPLQAGSSTSRLPTPRTA
jgi:Amt family ammonium transporter